MAYATPPPPQPAPANTAPPPKSAAPVSSPAYAPPPAPEPRPPVTPPPSAVPPAIFAAAAPAAAADFTPAPAFTPAPPFAAPPTYATTASYAAAPTQPDTAQAEIAEPPPAPIDEPFNPLAPPARTIEEERERLRDAAARDAYAPLDDTISRAWPPLAQAPDLGATADPIPVTSPPSPEAAAPFTYGGREEPARSVTGAPLPQFLIPDPATESPPSPPAQVPATADRFAELVYAARNRSIEFEPDALRERAPNRAPLLALVLASVVVAVSLLQYRSIEAFIPVTTGIFKAVGLR